MKTAHKYVSAQEAVKLIKTGNRVFVHGSASTPQILLNSLTERAADLFDVEIVSISLQGQAPFADKKYQANFRINSLFVSSCIRKAVNEGRGDYVPIFLSEIPKLFRSGSFPIDVALVQVSPPDKHGFCSLGTSVDIALAGMQVATVVIAQVNPRMPRTLGDGIVNVKDFDAMVEGAQELPELPADTPTEIAMRIGANCAGLVENGATIQMGIESIPNAVLASLGSHKELGVHT